MKFFEMWLDGAKIIISFIPIGIVIILVPALLCFAFDLLAEALLEESIFANILFHCKTYEEVWHKLKQKIKGGFKKK